jgi:beta-glucosidase
VHVDFETQARTVKASGHWYRDLIAADGFDAPAATASRSSEAT